MPHKLTPIGLSATPLYLTVQCRLGLNGVARIVSVKVPLNWLLREEVTSALDARVRRELVERWSEIDLCDPMF